MKSIKKLIIIFVFILVGIVTISPTALASSNSCDIAPFSFDTGITPERFQEPENVAMAANWCDFLQIISNVIGLLYMIVIPIVILMIIIGGVILMTSGGSEKLIKQGQGFIKSAIIGLIITLGAGIIIGAIIRGLGIVEEATLMPWLF